MASQMIGIFLLGIGLGALWDRIQWTAVTRKIDRVLGNQDPKPLSAGSGRQNLLAFRRPLSDSKTTTSADSPRAVFRS